MPEQFTDVAQAQEISRAQEIILKARLILGRVGMATAIAFGGVSTAISAELFTAENHPAVADTGGYPYADAPQVNINNYDWGYTECKGYCGWVAQLNGKTYYVMSERGYGIRNCTDWAAYRGQQLSGIMPTNLGDAKTWDENANGRYTVTSIPEEGDMAQSDAGKWGHVGVVEKVWRDAQGRITSVNISEYNRAGDGNYSYNTYTPDANGKYWRNTAKTTAWDHFIDLDGVSKPAATGIMPSSNESIVPYAAIADGQELKAEDGWVHTKIGGAAFPIKHINQWAAADTAKWGNMPTGPVPTAEVHDHEAGYGSSSAHPPRDGTPFYIDGQSQQYYFFRGRAYPIGPGELDDLGVRNKAVRVPTFANRIEAFKYGLVQLPDGSLVRFAGDSRVGQLVEQPDERVVSYHVNNETVLSCLQLVNGMSVAVLPQSVKPNLSNRWWQQVQDTNQVSACAFPSGMVLNGPGGVEQWRIEGDNSSGGYVRRYYPNDLTTYLHTSGNPQYRTLFSTPALNNIPEGQNMTLPNGIFFVNDGNGDQFKVENGVFRKIPWPDMNACLGNNNPVHVPGNKVGYIPQGPMMGCSFENRIFVTPDGKAYWAEGGRKHYIGAPAVRDCIVGRRGTSAPANVSYTTAGDYVPSPDAYCPYETELGLKFVQEQGDPTVWFVENNGTIRHVGSLCVGDPYTTAWKQFRVWTVPRDETVGHSIGPDFWANPTTCDQLPKVHL